MVSLSRNIPIAFVVGAAGFIGSHLVDQLLDKKIQVVGIDNLSTGSLENLAQAESSPRFYFFNQSAADRLQFGLSRLDYVFISLSEENSEVLLSSLDNIISLIRRVKSEEQSAKTKVVLVSSVDLYDKSNTEKEFLRQAEQRLAKLALENNLNIRVVRLAAIFGPRMHFKEKDPMIKLIKATVLGKLSEEIAQLDFISRAIFIDDAVDLLLRAMFQGATAQKIYDGALSYPVKVAEIKQVLLDPLWHESRGFIPTELPPWPTPNLMKTEKELAWKVETPMVTALKKTLHHFKERPALSMKIKWAEGEKEEEKGGQITKIEKKKGSEDTVKPKQNLSLHLPKPWIKMRVLVRHQSLILALILLSLGVIYPGGSIILGGLTIRSHLKEVGTALATGDFDRAKNEVRLAEGGVESIEQIIDSLFFLRFLGLGGELSKLDQLVGTLYQTTKASSETVYGTQALYQTLKSVSGEEEGGAKVALESAQIQLEAAGRDFGSALAKLSNPQTFSLLLGPIKDRAEDLRVKVGASYEMTKQARAFALMLPELIALNDKKTYLVILQDNRELRPGGGVIEAVAEVTFQDGKIRAVQVVDPKNLDQKLSARLQPPTEVRGESVSQNWSFKDLSFDPDFPTVARGIKATYHQATGTQALGVIALDRTAVADLLSALGPLVVDGAATSDKTVLEKGRGENFSTSVLKELLNQLLFVPRQNWPAVAYSLSRSLSQKHLMIFLPTPDLYTYTTSYGWNNILPRPKELATGKINDFLAVFEANLGQNNANQAIKRELTLKVSLDKDGGLAERLIVAYENKPAEFGGIFYRARLKVYLPTKSKVTGAKWGGKEMLTEMSQFSDYGRAGYSTLLTLAPGEKREFTLDYQQGALFGDNKLSYQLEVIKQPGTGRDSFNFGFSYPQTVKVLSSPNFQASPRQVTLSSDLSSDRSIQLSLEKIGF